MDFLTLFEYIIHIMNKQVNHFKKPQISVAPMMAWTDRHCRYFHRLISPNSLLYTEMVTTGAIIHGDLGKILTYNAEEHPIALQLGGNTPKDLAFSAKVGEDYGYDEINLNCGCPSDRVQNGAFGACLMNEPNLVADCIGAMQDTVKIPVTVKCRIGIDDSDDYTFLDDFVSQIEAIGCETFIIHARKAWLKGLSPKENREIPPLRYDIAQQLKDNHPNLNIVVNGGVKTVEETKKHLDVFDGIMIGREAYQNPWILAELEEVIYKTPSITRTEIVHAMQNYVDRNVRDGHCHAQSILRHVLGLFKAQRGGRIWRQTLSEQPDVDNILLMALEKIS